MMTTASTVLTATDPLGDAHFLMRVAVGAPDPTGAVRGAAYQVNNTLGPATRALDPGHPHDDEPSLQLTRLLRATENLRAVLIEAYSHTAAGKQIPAGCMGIRPGQVFVFACWEFDIDKALETIISAPRDLGKVDVEAAAQNYGLGRHYDKDKIRILGPHPDHFDADWACLHADLKVPLLTGIVNFAGGPATVLIDGMHRIHRASLAGFATLPAYQLSAQEMAGIEVGGIALPDLAA